MPPDIIWIISIFVSPISAILGMIVGYWLQNKQSRQHRAWTLEDRILSLRLQRLEQRTSPIRDWVDKILVISEGTNELFGAGSKPNTRSLQKFRTQFDGWWDIHITIFTKIASLRERELLALCRGFGQILDTLRKQIDAGDNEGAERALRELRDRARDVYLQLDDLEEREFFRPIAR